MKVLKKHTKYSIRVGRKLKKRFLYFGRNSGLHGFNHLFGENVIMLARIFWLIVLVLSSVCLYLLIVPLIKADGRIYFAPDTRYLEWITSFPAVTVCEQTNIKFSQKKFIELYHCFNTFIQLFELLNSGIPCERYHEIKNKIMCAMPVFLNGEGKHREETGIPWNQKFEAKLLSPLPYAHQRYLTELLYGRGTCSRALCSPCGEFIPCDVPWRNVMENVHKKCEELLSNCAYNGVEFPCCETFLPADSEHGPCFTFNALQNMEYTKKPLYDVNRTTGSGVLTFRILSDADVSLHSNEELVTKDMSEKTKFALHLLNANTFEVLFSVVEIKNDPALFNEDIVHRKCRFINEIPDDKIHTYSVYSHGACSLAVNTKHLLEHCGCVSPLRDFSYKSYYCNYTGMVCLTEHEVTKKKLGLDLDDDEKEECLPSCVESELYIKHYSKSFIPEYTDAGIRVKIEMASLPTLRYQRNLLRTNLDFVVSVGGVAGLFFGASVLSVIEIFYLALRKIKS